MMRRWPTCHWPALILLASLLAPKPSFGHRQGLLAEQEVFAGGREAAEGFRVRQAAAGSAVHLAKEVQDLSGDNNLLEHVRAEGAAGDTDLELPAGQRSGPSANGPREGYVTLCYRDSYVLGVRVLGQSLRETETSKDMVVLVSRGGVSADNINTLSADGWVVVMVDIVPNPGKGPVAKGRGGFPPRFWAVYTKLTVYTLTDYDKLIYLDADILVMANLDHLFACSGFCAVMRAGERFNSGLMVLEPDQKVYDKMMELISSTPSYTGGDQGFLNEYYRGILEAPVFRPHLPEQLETPFMRLTTEYNADVGGLIINSGLWHQQNEPKVLHYTLGPFKPWHWWMSWVAEQHSIWLEVRYRLGEDSHKYTSGNNFRCMLATWALVPLPWAVWVGLFLRRKVWSRGVRQLVMMRWLAGALHLLQRLWAAVSRAGPSKLYGPRTPWASGSGGKPSTGLPSFVRDQCFAIFGHRGAGSGSAVGLLQHQQGMLEAASLTGISSGIVSIGFAVTMVVPYDIKPVVAWLLVYEWTFLGISLAVWQFLAVCYRLGWASSYRGLRLAYGADDITNTRNHTHQLMAQGGTSGTDGRSAVQDAKGTCGSAVVQAWGVTAESIFLSAACLAISPWVPRLFGVHDLVAKILITAISGVAAIIIFCHSMGKMASVWFTAGMRDAAEPLTSNK